MTDVSYLKFNNKNRDRDVASETTDQLHRRLERMKGAGRFKLVNVRVEEATLMEKNIAFF